MNIKLFYQGVFLLLQGLCSGLPLMLVSSTLQTWMVSEHASQWLVGYATMLSLPYVLKPFWAPWLDYFDVTVFGARKFYILMSQLFIALGLWVLSSITVEASWVFMLTACVLSFFAATQDIVLDAYRIEWLPKEDLARSVVVFSMGYRLSMIVSGGGALILADWFGWVWTYRLFSLIMMGLMLLTFFIPRVEPMSKKLAGFNIKELFRNKHWNYGFWLLIVFYKAPEYLMLGLLPDFLINSVHMTLTQLGSLQKIYGMGLAILGGFVMAGLANKYSIERLLKTGLCMQAITAALYLFSSYTLSIVWASVAILFDNFSYGMATTAFGTFLMQNCDRQLAATQFALLTSLSSILRHLAGPVDLWLVSFSWDGLFLTVFALAVGLVIFSEKMLAGAKSQETT
ncbi:MAG TPA: MFS transporter [Gammaproteobacteria bacterium]|nr:MFS transporter [Gammaproteobacteria bacterium]